jgi:ATP-dependent helicase/DNAse subunit B
MFEGIQGNENWRKRFNKELLRKFEDLDIVSFVRKSRLNLIGHIKRMVSNRKVSQLFKNNLH